MSGLLSHSQPVPDSLDRSARTRLPGWRIYGDGMNRLQRLPLFLLKLLKLPPRLFYALGLGPLLGHRIMLLTTRGRRTGRKRITPLQFEEDQGVIYVGAMRGQQADWFRNILANPKVQVRMGKLYFDARAEAITDPERIADFIALRLVRHPRMMAAMLRAEGLPSKPTREQLMDYSSNLTAVALHPLKPISDG